MTTTFESRIAPYTYDSDRAGFSARNLLSAVDSMLPPACQDMRVLDIGCGNGFWCEHLARRGCVVVGIDPSETGIAISRNRLPDARFECIGVRPSLLDFLDESPFDLVLSVEVVEHLYSPGQWASACWESLKPGGTLICTTPYHGYLKNLAISLLGKWDRHFQPCREGGHIKFWSRRTLQRLLASIGFHQFRFQGAGRIPYLWRSIVLSAERSRV